MQPEITKLRKTCDALPAQWDAWDSTGQRWYIRYRWGSLSMVSVGPGGFGTASLLTTDEFDWEHPTDGMDGCMELWELKVILEPFARITCDED